MNIADEAKKLIKELEFGDKLEQIVKLADSASKVLEKIDIFVDRVGVAIELHTRTLGLILMLLGVFLCRLAISNVQYKEYTVCSSLQKSVLYFFYFSCMILATYFTFELLFELEILDKEEEYPLVWLLLVVVPLLDTLVCIMWCVIRGCYRIVVQRLTFAVLCAGVVLAVAVYVGVLQVPDDVE